MDLALADATNDAIRDTPMSERPRSLPDIISPPGMIATHVQKDRDAHLLNEQCEELNEITRDQQQRQGDMEKTATAEAYPCQV